MCKSKSPHDCKRPSTGGKFPGSFTLKNVNHSLGNRRGAHPEEAAYPQTNHPHFTLIYSISLPCAIFLYSTRRTLLKSKHWRTIVGWQEFFAQSKWDYWGYYMRYFSRCNRLPNYHSINNVGAYKTSLLAQNAGILWITPAWQQMLSSLKKHAGFQKLKIPQ